MLTPLATMPVITGIDEALEWLLDYWRGDVIDTDGLAFEHDPEQ